MRVINLVDNVLPINAGIWRAAMSTAAILKEHYGVESEIWFPAEKDIKHDFGVASPVALTQTTLNHLAELVVERKLNPETDIIVSHGAWQYPTHWGHRLKWLGFKWVYMPQGMLEPWSMSQKWFKKWLYFKMIEKRYATKADFVRAVGLPELLNLQKQFKRTILIPNGVPITEIKDYRKADDVVKVLFMGRLHHKKGVIPLAKAWTQSVLSKNSKYTLYVAGPDEGELEQLQTIISTQANIKYVGMVTGENKTRLLSECHYFVLPSFSEGFPTSVVEAMQFGMLPLISDGCNFPEAIEADVAIKISTEESDIAKVFNEIEAISPEIRKAITDKGQQLILDNYSLKSIAEKQYVLYKKMLNI